MRAGWEGNTRLQDFVRREPAGADLVVEKVVVAGAEILATKSAWDALTVSSGTIDVLVSGGVRIQASELTLAEHTTDDSTDSTRLTNEMPFDAILIEHLGNGAESREFHTFTARLDPRANGGNPKTVDHFIGEAYRVTRRIGADEINVDLIARSAPVDAVGEVGADFDFLLQPTSGRFPVVGSPPEGGSNSRPLTLLRIIAFKEDGEIADNVSWLSDSAEGSSKTDSSTYVVTHYSIIAATRQAAAQEGGTVWEFGGVVANMPRFSLTKASYATAVVTATGGSAVPDISGTGDLVIVARGEEWGDSVLLWEIWDGSAWVTCVDGDIVGVDNQVTIDGVSFGSDLSGVSTTGPWDMRVTLTPSTNNLRTPVAIDFGIERVTKTLLPGVATIEGGERRVDPLSLKAEISSAEIHIKKTAEKDYRDYGSLILSGNHIGDVEYRVHVGDPNETYLHRSEWMLHSVWDVEDYHSTKDDHVIEVLSPLRRIRVPIPPFVTTSGNDGTRKAIDVSGTRKAVWEELLDSLVGLPARYKGPGVEDTTNSIKKTISEGDAKDELDRVAYLGGETNIESQGRIKAVKVMRDNPFDTIVARFPLGSYDPVSIGPGFRARTDEFFVKFNFEESDGRFENERRYLNATAILKLGGAGLDTTQRLDEEAAKWIITEALADEVGDRVPKHFGNGQIVWEILDLGWHPQLELGDTVIIETDQFVARSPINSQPIRGLVSTIAFVVFVGPGKGKRLGLWVPGFEYITILNGDVTRTGQWERELSNSVIVWEKGGGVKLRTTWKGSKNFRAAFSGGSFPSEATVDAESVQALDSNRYGEVTDAGPTALDAEVFISFKGYDEASGGLATQLYTMKSRRPSLTAPRVQVDWVRVSSTTAALDLTIDDPTLSVTAVRFNKREGSEVGDVFTGFVSTWDRSTGTIGAGILLTRGEDVATEEGQESIIRWEIEFTDETGATQTVAGAQSTANSDEASTTLFFGISTAKPETNSGTWNIGSRYLTPVGATSQVYLIYVTLPVGVTITDYALRLYRETTDDTAIGSLNQIDNVGALTQLGTNRTHSGTGWSTLSDSGPSYTVVAEDQFMISVNLGNDAATGDARFLYASITFTRHDQSENY